MNETPANSMQHRSQTLSDAEALAALAGVTCLACDRVKQRRRPFCPTCESALTWQARADLANSLDEPWFGEAFRRHLRHLQLNTTRMRRFSVGGELPYRTMDEFEAAGYKCTGFGNCPVPRCGTEIAWMRTPDGNRLRLNRVDLRLHKPRCADPEYFERRRAAQTSAKRKRKKAS